VAGARVGEAGVCGGAGVHFCDLCGDVVAIGGSALLLLLASVEFGALCLRAAAVDVPHVVERRNCLAGNEVSPGRVEEGNGLTDSM
jgi:hypothetical protein